MCALQKEVPYHGRLYVTEAHACFYSSVLLKDTKVKRGFTRCGRGAAAIFYPGDL